MRPLLIASLLLLGLASVVRADERGPWGVDISVTFEGDATSALKDEWIARVQSASDLLWRLTEGQVHVRSCSIRARAKGGRITIPAELTRADRLPHIETIHAVALCESGGTARWQVTSIGRPDGRPGWRPLGEALAHELAHGIFGLEDEYHIPLERYECSRQREAGESSECVGCLMGPPFTPRLTDAELESVAAISSEARRLVDRFRELEKLGFDPRPAGPARTKRELVFCGADDHNKTRSAGSCRERIVAARRGVRFPNPDWNPESRPPRVVFTD